MMKAGGKESAQATNELISAQAQGTLPDPVTNPQIAGPLQKTVWETYTATAEQFNDPGHFTAMIGYEWTSVPGGNNLHRNVLFRDNKDRADQFMPFYFLAERESRKTSGSGWPTTRKRRAVGFWPFPTMAICPMAGCSKPWTSPANR